MSSKNRTNGRLPMNCPDCFAPVRKTASGAFVCTGCDNSSRANLVK